MAKQKKKRNKKYKPNPTRDRIDMRTGGRVKYQPGGLNEMNGKTRITYPPLLLF